MDELEERKGSLIVDILKASMVWPTTKDELNGDEEFSFRFGDVTAMGKVVLFPDGIGVQMLRPMELYAFKKFEKTGLKDTAANLLIGLYCDWATMKFDEDKLLAKLKEFKQIQMREENGLSFSEFFKAELSMFQWASSPMMLLLNLAEENKMGISFEQTQGICN